MSNYDSHSKWGQPRITNDLIKNYTRKTKDVLLYVKEIICLFISLFLSLER